MARDRAIALPQHLYVGKTESLNNQRTTAKQKQNYPLAAEEKNLASSQGWEEEARERQREKERE